ncbi:hypothetical protein M0804_000372 [Polistes exclamans]|nr:hypothetical protein M0804_000372 [Polistes exclamans]
MDKSGYNSIEIKINTKEDGNSNVQHGSWGFQETVSPAMPPPYFRGHLTSLSRNSKKTVSYGSGSYSGGPDTGGGGGGGDMRFYRRLNYSCQLSTGENTRAFDEQRY